MFPRMILETFSVSSSKTSYLISEAVDPYFNTLNIEGVKKSSSSFTIHHEETTNKQVKNSLILKVSFGQKQIQLLNCIILKHI